MRITRVFLATMVLGAAMFVAAPSPVAANEINVTWGPAHSNTTRTYWLTGAGCYYPTIDIRVDVALGTVTGTYAYVKSVKYTYYFRNTPHRYSYVDMRYMDVQTNGYYDRNFVGDGWGNKPYQYHGQYWGITVNRNLYDGSGYIMLKNGGFVGGCAYFTGIYAITTSSTPQ